MYLVPLYYALSELNFVCIYMYVCMNMTDDQGSGNSSRPSSKAMHSSRDSLGYRYAFQLYICMHVYMYIMYYMYTTNRLGFPHGAYSADLPCLECPHEFDEWLLVVVKYLKRRHSRPSHVVLTEYKTSQEKYT